MQIATRPPACFNRWTPADRRTWAAAHGLPGPDTLRTFGLFVFGHTVADVGHFAVLSETDPSDPIAMTTTKSMAWLWCDRLRTAYHHGRESAATRRKTA